MVDNKEKDKFDLGVSVKLIQQQTWQENHAFGVQSPELFFDF